MPTGDEPMLPQPADDNAPMISGRGTKIIADARGAYLAGNFRDLLEHLNEAQLERYKSELVSNIGSVIRVMLAAMGIENNSASPEVNALYRLLDEPDSEIAQEEVTAYLMSEDYPDWISLLLTQYLVMIEYDPTYAPAFAQEIIVLLVNKMFYSTEINLPYWWASKNVRLKLAQMSDWLMHAAWVCFMNKPVPSIHTFEGISNER